MTDAVGVLTENKRAMWEEIWAEFSLRQELYSAILPGYSLISKTSACEPLMQKEQLYRNTTNLSNLQSHFFFFAVLKAFH